MTDYTSAEFWKGAPEGATHYFAPFFYKVEGQCVWLFDDKWEPSAYISSQLERLGAKRPAPQWSGEGLPPVGITCKIPDDMAAGNPFLERFEGKTAHIVAHTTSVSGTPLAVFWYEKSDGSRRYHALADNGNFEPIRAPSQIAADEREAAIEEMWNIYWQPNAPTAKQALGLLYDAGYRKGDAK